MSKLLLHTVQGVLYRLQMGAKTMVSEPLSKRLIPLIFSTEMVTAATRSVELNNWLHIANVVKSTESSQNAWKLQSTP